jgi:hypothetical protein
MLNLLHIFGVEVEVEAAMILDQEETAPAVGFQ